MVDTPETPDAAEAKTAGDASPRAAQKVELDLDDAPFLDEEPEPSKTPETPPQAESSPKLPAPDAPKASNFKDRLLAHKKKLIIAGGAFVLLLVVGIGVNFFLFRSPTPPPPAPEPEARKVLLPDKPPPLPAAAAPKYQLAWESFWVEQRDSEGAIRFLVTTFTIPTDSAQLYSEMQVKKVILRDAIFYYLRNRPFMLFSDPEKVAALKRDLMTVINEHVASGKVEDIFIENYLVK